MDEAWYMDTGANQHMAPKTTKAHGTLPYTRTDTVMIGNGSGLPIFSLGNFQVPNTSLAIKNALIVPDIKKKLLSISQFATDNNCYFVFYPWGVFTKVLDKSRVLFKGLVEGGL